MVIAGQDLASPCLTVIPVAGTVEGECGHTGETVAVGHERSYVGPVVLHVDEVRRVFLRKL